MSGDSGGTEGNNGPPDDLPPRAALTMYRATIFYRLAVLAVIFGGSTLFVRYGFLPVVREVSGQSTSFEFSVGVNISLILNVSLMAAFGLSEAGRRKANKELRESRQTEEGG